MSERLVAWSNLASAARAFATSENKETRDALSREAKAWAAVETPKREATGERSAVAGDGFVMPFGRDKGKRLSELDVRSLRWWEGVFARDVDDEAKEKFREQNRNRLEQVRARLRELGEAGDW